MNSEKIILEITKVLGELGYRYTRENITDQTGNQIIRFKKGRAAIEVKIIQPL